MNSFSKHTLYSYTRMRQETMELQQARAIKLGKTSQNKLFLAADYVDSR
ncbi:MAG: hypothetical protein ACI9E1_000274 [Cryomorphaceae bacterium]|jgi:hypothetical protein